MAPRLSLLSLCFLLAASGCTSVEPATAPPVAVEMPPTENIDERIVEELNYARTDPSGYADLIALRVDSFNGKEGKRAILECIRVLRVTKPLPPLTYSEHVAQAARDHVMDQGFTEQIGHDGSDGSDPFERIDRYVVTRGAGEAIQYGRYTARDIVMELLIDDGVPDRGHRKNILDPNYEFVGVATGPHGRYGHMCVMDFTYAYEAW